MTIVLTQMKDKELILCDNDIMNFYADNAGSDMSMIIDSGCPSSLAERKVVEAYIRNNNMNYE